MYLLNISFFSRVVKVLAVFTISLVLLAGCGEDDTQPDRSDEPRGRALDYPASVTFLNYDREAITSIRAAIADTEQTRQEGLMDVHNLPTDRGMIFIFPEEKPLSFWMANTPLSLDIIFVNQEREIVRIHQSTPPYSSQNFRSERPAIYAIEVNAGFSARHDLQEGMFIDYDLSANDE